MHCLAWGVECIGRDRGDVLQRMTKYPVWCAYSTTEWSERERERERERIYTLDTLYSHFVGK